jgi:hypothetical protein
MPSPKFQDKRRTNYQNVLTELDYESGQISDAIKRSWHRERHHRRMDQRQQPRNPHPSMSVSVCVGSHVKHQFQVTEIGIRAAWIDGLDHQLARGMAIVGTDRDVSVHVVIGACVVQGS